MIFYTKSSLRIAELHFQEEAPAPAVDVVRYQSRLERMPGTHSYEFHTIHVDLQLPQDKLLAGMNSTKRNLIRRAAKEQVAVDFFAQPDEAVTDEFFGFYDAFAGQKGLPVANRSRLNGIRDGGALVLSRAKDGEGSSIVWHCYLRASGSARLIHSASLFRASADKDYINYVSRANCYHHWFDMLRLQEAGLETYDLGGWYEGKTDQAKLNINTFKEGFGGKIVRLYNTDHGRTLRGVMAVHMKRAMDHWRGEKQ